MKPLLRVEVVEDAARVKGANANHNFVAAPANWKMLPKPCQLRERAALSSPRHEAVHTSFNQQQTTAGALRVVSRKKPKALRPKHLQTHKEKLAAFAAR